MYHPLTVLCYFVICRDPSKPAIDEAGFLSLMFLTWASPVISKGFKRTLQLDDFDKISPYESAEVNFQRISRLWNEEVKQKGLENASMHRVIWRAVRTRTSFGIFFLLLSQLVSFLVPVNRNIVINLLILLEESYHRCVDFRKRSILTPKRVAENTKGEGGVTNILEQGRN